MIHDVLRFWFESDDLRAAPDDSVQRRWFSADAAFDRAVVDRFGALLDAPARVDAWRDTPAGALAAILVLDQFPRNAFRGTARAFATDAAALAIASRLVDTGWDREFGVTQRLFAYLPFQHAEDLGAQDRAMALFTALADQEETARRFLPFARDHHAAIARFGRFPGRNAALGRPDGAGEAEWLASGGPTWGQR